jgi:hypothetical protein
MIAAKVTPMRPEQQPCHRQTDHAVPPERESDTRAGGAARASPSDRSRSATGERRVAVSRSAGSADPQAVGGGEGECGLDVDGGTGQPGSAQHVGVEARPA